MKRLLLLLLLLPTLAFGQATGYVKSDYPSNGSIGTAATTVDVYSRININQTTAGITLTVPNPTNTSTKVVEVWIGNIGTVPFTLNHGGLIDTASAVILKWTGSNWYVVGRNTPPDLSEYIRLDGTSSPTTGNIQIGSNKGIEWGANSYLQGTSTYIASTVTDGADLSTNINQNSAAASLTAFDGSTSDVAQVLVTATSGIGLKTSDYYSYLRTDNLTADRTVQFQNSNGTLAYLTDIPTVAGVYVPIAGGTMTGPLLAPSIGITGTAGAGYVKLIAQSSRPTAVGGSMLMYGTSTGGFGYIKRNIANSADIYREHSYPDQNITAVFQAPVSGTTATLANLETANVFTQQNTFTTSTNFSNLISMLDPSLGYIQALRINTTDNLTVGGGFATVQVSAQLVGAGNITSNANFRGDSYTNRTSGTDLTIATLTRSGSVTANTVITTGVVSSGAFQSGNVYLNVGTSSGTRGNLGIFTTTGSFGGGERVTFVSNMTTAPTSNPTGGYVNWSDAGNWRMRSSGGGITTIGTAGVSMEVAGQGLLIKEGTNATLGTATLVAGTVTVSTTKVTANSRIFVTIQTAGGTVSTQYISARTAGTSFTITSLSALDTSTVAWFIVEPN